MGVGGFIGVFGGLVLAFIAFIRIFLWRQITDLRSDVDRLNEDRAAKHKAFNDVARLVMALELVQRLAEECKCGVLSPLQEIIDRMVDELETVKHYRADDLA